MIFVGSKRKVAQTYYHTACNEIRKLAFRSPYKNKAPMCVVRASRTDKRVTGLEPATLSLGS